MRRATVGKLLGLAGLAGVAATSAVLVRDERQRRAYTPDDVRARLHQRADLAAATEGFHAARGKPTPEMVELPAPDGAGSWVVPAAPTRRGRLVQRARWQVRRLPVAPFRRLSAPARRRRP